MNKNVKKAVSMYHSLTKAQQKKLEKDFNSYVKASVIPQINKINSMLESGFYTGDTRSWLYKIRNKYLHKRDFINYVLQNGFSYSSL